MSRISIIRDVVVQFGGHSDFVYYADKNDAGDAVYKVSKWYDGLSNDEVRQTVVDELNKHPQIKRAYMSRPVSCFRYGINDNISGPHIKVVFDGISESVKKSTKTKRAKRVDWRNW